MIEQILPAETACAESFGEPVEQPMFAVEEMLISTAVPARRLEFADARACARRALARLGLPPGPIPRGPAGAPVWPAGFVGSITHCPGYRAAVVARTAALASLGIDAEPNEPLPEGVSDLALLADERDRVAELSADHPGVHWDTLVFSAKESVYKAWYPLTGQWLEFGDVRIAVDPLERTFEAGLDSRLTRSEDGSADRIPGLWMIGTGLILTAVAVPPRRQDLTTEPAWARIIQTSEARSRHRDSTSP